MAKTATVRRTSLRLMSLVLACLFYSVARASSPVADAVMRGESGAVLERLITAKADVDAAQADGSTALHWAAYRGDTHAAAALLAAGARPDLTTDTGMTPLALACEGGNADMVQLLLDGGADANQTLQHGETPLMMAARTGRPKLIELLLAHGARLEARDSLRGTTALMWAAANAAPDAARMLLDHGADANAHSGTTQPGRLPYLAPPGRERIQEFIDGTGLRGAVVEDGSGSAAHDPAAKALAQHRVQVEIAAAKEALARFDMPAKYAQRGDRPWGGLTPLMFAAREGNLETVKLLLEKGARINEQSEFGWSALLVATQNRYYRLGAYLLEHGANPNLANGGGWTPLYIATDNRNIEAGDYPVRKPDMDHLEFIRLLLAAHANPNLRMRSSTETRTVFTQQWLNEEGATPFLRAAQSGDLALLKLLLEHGADPSIPTDHNVTPLMVASGIGWVEGVTYEWSPEATLNTVKLLLDLGADVNAQDTLDGRTALMGAAHKGRSDVIQLLVQRGANLAIRDIGSRDSIHAQAGVTWQAVDYADGLVRVGVQSAIPHPETAALLRRLMQERGLEVPAEGRTLVSICVTEACK